MAYLSVPCHSVLLDHLLLGLNVKTVLYMEHYVAWEYVAERNGASLGVDRILHIRQLVEHIKSVEHKYPFALRGV